MKKLILINIVLLTIYFLIPIPNKPVIVAREIEIKEEPVVTSRSIESPREVEQQMVTSQVGIDLIKKYEGCRLTSYKLKGESNYTIGYGHSNWNIQQGNEITLEQAEELLKNDLERFEGYVRNTRLELNQNEFDALVSFTFNCGKGNLDKLVSGRNKQEIAEHIVNYTKSGNTANRKGLKQRRLEEKELFLGGNE